ncbi:MAG: flagellar biosynthetic protein FliO [Acetatifactor sp.]|nr:flagellar biosynthetic protein FliO [Acetatifactor sp.]
MLLTGMDGYLQLITVLVVFVVVLSITALVTKYIARYQKAQGVGSNIEVLETAQIAVGKYIQLVRLGGTYAAIAVCKDTVTMLCQVPEEQITKKDQSGEEGMKFRELLGSIMRRESTLQRQDDVLQKPEGEQTDGFDR